MASNSDVLTAVESYCYNYLELSNDEGAELWRKCNKEQRLHIIRFALVKFRASWLSNGERATPQGQMLSRVTKAQLSSGEAIERKVRLRGNLRHIRCMRTLCLKVLSGLELRQLEFYVPGFPK